ncbi:MAG: segregation and condensation protein A [Myxococcota bacterium]
MSTKEPPQPLDPSFRIALPTFEGPLDLLLHLCQKHELEILDLPIAFVTEKYLEYIETMKRLDLDVASEYLVMAAELARIKSKMLLPPSPDEEEEEGTDEELDPRAELIRRLLEYQKYKKVAEDLGSRGVEGRDVFLRGVPAPQAEGPAPLADVSVFKLIDALHKILDRVQGEVAFEISAERISIQDRISQITDKLRLRSSLTFEELFEEARSTYDIVVTFLALLEMAKMRMVRLYQPDPHAAIHLESRVLQDDGSDEDAEGAEPLASGAEAVQDPDADELAQDPPQDDESSHE